MVRFLRPDLHALTGAYAVDALDAAERERFERHLGRCPSCAHEVRGMQETATRLAIAVAAPPPAGLKAAVLTAAAQTRQHPPVVDAGPAEQAPLPQARHRHGGARSRRRFRLAVPVAALATAAAIALGVTVGVQQSRLDQVQAQQHEVTAVLSAPDARIVSGRTALGGHTTMVVAASLDKMVFTAAGLPALAARPGLRALAADAGRRGDPERPAAQGQRRRDGARHHGRAAAWRSGRGHGRAGGRQQAADLQADRGPLAAA